MDLIDTPHFPLRSTARGDTARLRSWYWGVVWAELTARGRSHAWRVLAKLPLRAARRARAAATEWGAAARAATGVSVATQLRRTWWLQVRHGIVPDTVYRHQLFHSDRWPRAAHFIQRPEAARLYRLLGSHGYRDEIDTLADKRRFAAWCEGNGLPTVDVRLELEGGRVTRDRTGGLGLPTRDLFSKQAADYGGKGAALWRFVGDGAYERDGVRFTADELLRELMEQSLAGPVIVQHREATHPALLPVAPSALSTVRVMTLRWPGAPARLLSTVFRMSISGAVMDNLTQGGIVSAVDRESGTLGPAVRLDERLCRQVHERHPDTGAPIAGLRLPYWADVLALALRAHDALGDVPCVGWDVALVERGALLLEGNWNPGVQLPQLPEGAPLGATDYARCLSAHLESRFPRRDWKALLVHSRWEPGAEIRRRGQPGPAALPATRESREAIPSLATPS